ncbi:MAG: 4'-phosphopantetheinyl transferase superfamily protein [Gammaproteobacteria bacterium]|nr:4'-phosphopantetheinyl transferase superfamily protein [Gammaproteobacteria bacterium]
MVVRPGAVAECPLEWVETGPGVPLPENGVHLWFVDLQSSPRLSRFAGTDDGRSPDIRGQEKRALYLGGKRVLRTLLVQYSGLAHCELEFGYGTRGKPCLRNPGLAGVLKFNYTLSRGYALYAFAWNAELGVDLEIYPRKVNAGLLARRKLSPEERSSWEVLPAEQKNNAMLMCWTRKEAYGKALGVGIRYEMRKVPLFRNLHGYRWKTRVGGLFGDEKCTGIDSLHGVQIALPVPGAASLMYAGSPPMPESPLPLTPMIPDHRFTTE